VDAPSWTRIEMYFFLNIFFWVFHTTLVLFNLFGWLFPKTRRLNLITLSITAFSWFVMGIGYGWGYCICTDWHWQVRRHLGYPETSPTFIHLLLLNLTGVNFSVAAVENLTLAGFVISIVGSLWTNGRDRARRRHAPLVQ
jgi:hypothetical protein